MQAIRALEEQEAQEDLFFGQVAIIWARWFLILAGGILVLWNSEDLSKLTLGIIPIGLLMAMNFYLHGKYLMEQPVGGPMVLLTGCAKGRDFHQSRTSRARPISRSSAS